MKKKEIIAWKTLSSKLVFSHEWAKLRQDKVELPDGRIIDDYFVTLRPDVVLIYPITPDGKLVLVKQYKHGAGKILLEFPGGYFDPNTEKPLDAAKRELEEETGFVSQNYIHLASLWENTTKNNNKTHFFLAKDAEQTGKICLDENEDIETLLISKEKFSDMMHSQKIEVTDVVTLYYLAEEYLKNEKL